MTKKVETDSSAEADVRGAWQRAQEQQALSHAAPVCAAHGVQFAVCGCEPQVEVA